MHIHRFSGLLIATLVTGLAGTQVVQPPAWGQGQPAPQSQASASQPTAPPALQRPTPAPGLRLGGQILASPSAQLSLSGRLTLLGEDAAKKAVQVVLQFPPLQQPKYGSHSLVKDGPLRITVGDQLIRDAKLDILQLDGTAIGGLTWLDSAGATQELTWNLPARVAEMPCLVEGKPASNPSIPLEVLNLPGKEDLVFCAVGGAGSPFPGRAQVFEGIARTAATGPLDFLVLLGDNFYGRQPETVTDPLWDQWIEQRFDKKRLNVPIYALLGRRDYDTNWRAQIDYSAFGRRWAMTNYVYSFGMDSHGKRLEFFAIDSTASMGDISDPQNRIALRLFTHALQNSKADWKIVLSYQPMYSCAKHTEAQACAKLRERFEYALTRFGVDVFIAGGDRILAVTDSKSGTIHVNSGAAGGREMCDDVVWQEATAACHAGPGFAWFRFDGRALEISLRDQDGKPLYVQRVVKAAK